MVFEAICADAQARSERLEVGLRIICISYSQC